MTILRNFPCILCEKRTKPQERRFLSRDNNKPLRKYLFKTFFVSVHDGDVLCGKCRRLYYTDYNQKLECTSCISFTSTDNHDIEYQPTSSKLQQEIKKWTREGDVFVVDRGFRDSVDFLNELGIPIEMPAFLDKGQKQLTTEQSNTSRLVTKIRWVVQSANGRLKSWKYFDKVLPNSQIPFIGDYIQIICSICYKYFSPLSHGNQEEDRVIGCIMLFLAKQNNDLKTRIENEGIEKIKSAEWTRIDAINISFPALSEEEIRCLARLTWYTPIAKSYVQEHLNEHAEFTVYVCKQDEHLICAKLQSRHVSS